MVSKKNTLLCILCVVIGIVFLSILLVWLSGKRNNLPSVSDSTIARSVTVKAAGEVEVVPDVAILSLGVQTEAATVLECREQNNQRMNGLVAALTDLGVPESFIKTTGLHTIPKHSYSEEGVSEISGYSANTYITVRIENMELTGPVIDKAVYCGVNYTGDIVYKVSNHEEIYREALHAAVENARAKAEAMTKGSGNQIGDALIMTEGAYAPSYSPVMRSTVNGVDAAVMPGLSVITAEVTVAYELIAKSAFPIIPPLLSNGGVGGA